MSDVTSPYSTSIPAGTVVGGDFEVIEALGAGGMGVVYRASQKSTSREVALKFVRPDRVHSQEAVERLRREVLALARVEHPNVVSVISSGVEPDGSVFIAMEKVEGRSLQEVLNEEQYLSPRVAVTVLSQIASALAAAHQKGILHRDVKPENILIRSQESDRIWSKLLDFGLATMTDQHSLTSTGVVMGSPAYMAPERWVAERQADGRSDLYALGCVGYEMLTGKRPFRGDSAPSLMAAHCYTVPVDPELARATLVDHRALTQILRRCLQMAPDARYQSAEELVEALTNLEALYRAREAAGPAVVALPEVSSEAMVMWSERDVATGELSLPPSPAFISGSSTSPAMLDQMGMSDTVAVTTDKNRTGHATSERSMALMVLLTIAGLVVAGWFMSRGQGPAQMPSKVDKASSPSTSIPEEPTRTTASALKAPKRAVDEGAQDTSSGSVQADSVAPASTKAAHARVKVVALPSDALISVDGDTASQGPRELQLRPDQVLLVKAKRAGYSDRSRRLSYGEFEVGKETTVTLRLERKKLTKKPRPKPEKPNSVDTIDPRLRIESSGGGK